MKMNISRCCCVINRITWICLCFCFVYIIWSAGLIYQETEVDVDDMLTNDVVEENHEMLWLQKRQELLSRNGSTKILLFCYMRGGSSLSGEIFNTDTNAILWYEPLAAFYAAYYGLRYASKPYDVIYTANGTRILTDVKERENLVGYITNLFNCRYDLLPPQAWLHPFTGNGQQLQPIKSCVKLITHRDPLRRTCPGTMPVCGTLEEAKQRNCFEILQDGRKILGSVPHKNLTIDQLSRLLKDISNISRLANPLISDQDKDGLNILAENMLCVDRLSKRNNICMRKGMEICSKRHIHAAEVLRLKMEDVDTILLDNPDVHVIHYVRDPRGTALSRISTAHLMVDENKRDIWYETDFLCKQMREDLKHRQHLDILFPGSVTQVRYEDLVLDPIETVKNIYSRLGLQLSKSSSWEQFAEKAFFNHETGRQFGTLRKNGSESVFRWRSKISKENLLRIKSSCLDVFRMLGYPEI